jgi:hypothetical protein
MAYLNGTADVISEQRSGRPEVENPFFIFEENKKQQQRKQHI